MLRKLRNGQQPDAQSRQGYGVIHSGRYRLNSHRVQRTKGVAFCVLLVIFALRIFSKVQNQTLSIFEGNGTISVKDVQLSLVTGFWAQKENEKSHPHRLEIEAAILANLENPFLDQVVVILDSVSEEANCGHFLRRMQDLRRESGNGAAAQLACIPHDDYQPSYFEMFQYTLHPEVKGEIVVLSNTDQVFDDTLRLAKNVPARTILTLSTSGYNTTVVPISIQHHYQSYIGKPELESTMNRCRSKPYNRWKELGNYSDSWDSYIFHADTIRNDSLMRPNAFKRRNFQRNLVPFYMNELGAENAALHGLVDGISNITLWNACSLIKSWHFHLAPKTHRNDTNIWPRPVGNKLRYHDRFHPNSNTPFDSVPPPRASIPMCSTLHECFSHRPANGAYLQAQDYTSTFLR